MKIHLDALLSKLPLEEREKKILKQVFLVSLGACVLIVAAVWTTQWFKTRSVEVKDEPEIIAEMELNLDLDSLDLDAHRLAARHYMQTNQAYNAVKHLRRIIAVEKGCRPERLELATAYLRSALYARALAIFKNLIEEDTKDSLVEPIMARYGLALFHSGHQKKSAKLVDKSVEVLDETLKKFPRSAETACYRGQVEAATNMASPLVEKYLHLSISLDSTYAEPWYQLARYTMNKPDPTRKDLLDARTYLQSVLLLEPISSKAHSRLGMVYYYLEQYVLARKEYEIALALNPNDYNTYYNLGELYHHEALNEPKKALAAYKKALELDSSHAAAHFKAGLVSLEAHSRHSEANYKAGLITLGNNMLNESIRFFSQAHELAPKNIRILFQLAVAYEKKKMFDDARRTYQKVLRIEPMNEIAKQKLRLLDKPMK